MSWKCYSCGTQNANENAVCSKCGNTVAAPAAFYFKWIPGAALFFAFFYTIGVMAGGVLVEAAAAPDEQAILKAANEKREADKKVYVNLMQLQPEEVAAARAVALQRSRAAMSDATAFALHWTLPIILFFIGGIIVGFVSDGKTIIEAAIGSLVGQALAVALIVHGMKMGGATSWTAFFVGALPGVVLGGLGAWLGEIIQEKKERFGRIG
jgi:hypothetical protein